MPHLLRLENAALGIDERDALALAVESLLQVLRRQLAAHLHELPYRGEGGGANGRISILGAHGIEAGAHSAPEKRGRHRADTIAPVGIGMTLYTFGYEGLDLGAFLARLEEAGVRRVVDVRELPLSRKKGFSKSALSAALAAHGIEYLHMNALGCPKAIRQRFKLDGNWHRYERSFREYLRSQTASVRTLAALAKEKASCLLCFEADYSKCHRSLVARAAVAVGAPPLVHLNPETMISDAPLRAAA
jgi:uncharacterized protein YeaO (DUF488 family)